MGIEVVMRQVFFGAGNYHLVDKNFEPLPVSDHYFPDSVSRLPYTEGPYFFSSYEEQILSINSVLSVPWNDELKEILEIFHSNIFVSQEKKF